MTQNNVGIYASQISGHLWAPNGAYDALATTTLSATTANVTFAGIPQGYKHLQIRGIAQATAAGNEDIVYLQANGDTGSNYSWHLLTGNGSAASANAGSSTTSMRVGRVPASSIGGSIFGAMIIDILDYANISKNKTVRSLNGVDYNGGGQVAENSGAWYSTSAVTSLTLTIGGNFVQYSQFALYGVK